MGQFSASPGYCQIGGGIVILWIMPLAGLWEDFLQVWWSLFWRAWGKVCRFTLQTFQVNFFGVFQTQVWIVPKTFTFTREGLQSNVNGMCPPGSPKTCRKSPHSPAGAGCKGSCHSPDSSLAKTRDLYLSLSTTGFLRYLWIRLQYHLRAINSVLFICIPYGGRYV